MSDIKRYASESLVETTASTINDDLNAHKNDKNNPHEVTAEQVGAVNKSGDTMTGNLTIEGSYPSLEFYATDTNESFIFTGRNGTAYISSQNIEGDTSNRRIFDVNNSSVADLQAALQLYDFVDGNYTGYNVLHTGNKNLITAADVGARPDTWMPTAADVGALPNPVIIGNVDMNSLTVAGVYRNQINTSAEVRATLNLPVNENCWLDVLVMGAGVGANVANRVTQIAARPYNFNRDIYVRFKHDSAWSGWQKLSTTDKVLLLDGSNAMTGPLKIDSFGGNKGATLRGTSQGISLQAISDFDNESDYRELLVYNNDTKTDDATALVMYNGKTGALNHIIHTGNKNLITPADIGAAPSSHYHTSASIKPAYIELTPGSTSAGHGGFIDFHYNNNASDYTARIIEYMSGILTVDGAMFIDKAPVVDPRVRNIYAGTTDMTAGSSSLTTGTIYFVYE